MNTSDDKTVLSYILLIPWWLVAGTIIIFFLWPMLFVELYRKIRNIPHVKGPAALPTGLGEMAMCIVVAFWIYVGLGGWYWYTYHIATM